MRDIYFVFRLGRVQRAMENTGAMRDVPDLPATIQVSGQTYQTGLAFFEANQFGWRRFDFLKSRGMMTELGPIDGSSDYLFIAVLPEERVNVLRQFTAGIQVWTLREFLSGFPDDYGSSSSSSNEDLLPEELINAWPANWYVVSADGQHDPTKPMVRMAPARARGLLNAGVDAVSELEWVTGSTQSDAETVVQQNGTPT